MSKQSEKRARILAKTSGRCAYCGQSLDDSRWHMDHIDPIYRGRDDIGGDDSEDNLIAACARCNRWKKTFSVDEFRGEIAAQSERLYRDSPAYRLAHDFGIVAPIKSNVKFYFETLTIHQGGRA